MNSNRLAQDHPCVIDIIRRHYLNAPQPAHVPYNLTNNGSTSDNYDPSAGQSSVILNLLKNLVITVSLHITIRATTYTYYAVRISISGCYIMLAKFYQRILYLYLKSK